MIKLKSIKEILVERLEKTEIFEMSFQRRKILDTIRGFQIPINEHLIKLLRYKDEINKQKHINDLETWLYDIQDMYFLKSNKKLSKEDYFEVLFNEPITSKDNVSYLKNKEKGKLRDYQSLPKIRDEKETLTLLYDCQVMISKLLSTNSISDFFIFLNKKVNN